MLVCLYHQGRCVSNRSDAMRNRKTKTLAALVAASLVGAVLLASPAQARFGGGGGHGGGGWHGGGGGWHGGGGWRGGGARFAGGGWRGGGAAFVGRGWRGGPGWRGGFVGRPFIGRRVAFRRGFVGPFFGAGVLAASY